MEYIAPVLQCTLDIQSHMRSGDSVKISVQKYIDHYDNDFTQNLKLWFIYDQQGQDNLKLEIKWPSFYSKSLMQIIARGLEGEPILKSLAEIEAEIVKASKYHIDKYMERLSLISMLPLLFFQFPAFILLLFGPVFKDLLEKLSS